MIRSAQMSKKLRMHELFSSVEPDILETAMEGESKVCSFRRGDMIFGEGERSMYIAYVLTGSIMRRKRENALCIERLTQGSLIGLESIFSPVQSSSEDILATRESRVLFLSKTAMFKILQMDPEFALKVIQTLAGRVTTLERRVTTYTGGDAQSRLARFLLESFGENETIVLRISMQQLATMLDISRPSLYRAFSFLQEDGVVVREGKNIRLVDKDALLAKFSQD